jgi:hypothetical protein
VPQSVHTQLVVGLVDGRVAGVASACYLPVRRVDRVIEFGIGSIGDATDPRLQQRGVRSAIRRFVRAQPIGGSWLGLVEGASTPDPVEVPPIANELSFYLKVLHAREAARSRRGPTAIGALGYAWLQLRGRIRGTRREPSATCTIRAVEAFDDRVGAFAEDAIRPWALIAVPTAELLNWRYLDPRAGTFSALIAEAHGRLLGYVVYAKRWGRGDITDLLTRPDRPDVARALIDAAVAALEADGAPAVECRMMRHHPYADALSAAGFTRIGNRSAALTRQFRLTIWDRDHAELAPLQDPRAPLHIVHGYFDEA